MDPDEGWSVLGPDPGPANDPWVRLVGCSAKAGGWGSAAANEPAGRRGWFLWRRKWSILSVIGVLVFAFFRYGGVAPPPQDNDFITVTGTEVRRLKGSRTFVLQPFSQPSRLPTAGEALRLRLAAAGLNCP